MRHGLFLPPFDALANPDLLVELALDAEQSGWDGFFLWDHLKYGTRVRDILDPYICLTAVAAATSSMELGVMVTPLVRRRPAVVARQAVTLDHVSHGRLILGFGLGDDYVGELSSFGDEVDAKVRGQMLSEGLEVLTELHVRRTGGPRRRVLSGDRRALSSRCREARRHSRVARFTLA